MHCAVIMTGRLTRSKSSVVYRAHRCFLLEFPMALEALAALKWPFVFQWVIQFCDQLDNLLIFPSEIGPCHYLAVLQADDFFEGFFFHLGAVQWYWTSGSIV